MIDAPPAPSDRLRGLIQTFHANALTQADEIETLRGRLATTDWREDDALDRLSHLTHKLAGSAGSLGFPDVGREAVALELILSRIRENTRDVGHRPERIAQAGLLARVLVDHIRAMRPENSAFDSESALDGDASLASGPVEVNPRMVVTIGVEQDTLDGLTLLDVTLIAVETLEDWKERVPRPPIAVVVDLAMVRGEATLTAHLAALPRQTTVMAVGGAGTFPWRVRAARVGARVYLPHCDARDLLDHVTRVTGKSREGPARVLVLEDDEILAAFYTTILTEAGIEAEFLTDPAQILESLSAFEPDVLISDLHMPGYSGAEVAVAIRHGGRWGTLPIVFLSREQDLEHQIAALSSGADFFLPKPIEPEFLVSVALDRTDRSRALRDMTLRDPLTRLYNHTASLDFLEREVARAHRGRAPLSLALIDIDHFKAVNDTHGHHAGDQVIKTLAYLMRGRLRASDITGRCGGEEFLAILPSTPPENALVVLDDLRRAFAGLTVDGAAGPFSTTFSVGVADLSGGGDGSAEPLDARALFNSADAALYEAKRQGRNRVVLASPTSSPYTSSPSALPPSADA